MVKVSEQFKQRIKRVPSSVLREFMREAAEYIPPDVLRAFIERIPEEPKKIRAADYQEFIDMFEEDNPTPELVDELEKKKPEDYFMARFPDWKELSKKELRNTIRAYMKVADFPDKIPVADWIRYKLTGKYVKRY